MTDTRPKVVQLFAERLEEAQARKRMEEHARGAFVAAHGPTASAWLIFKHRKPLHRAGAIDFYMPKRYAPMPMWFWVAMEFLRTRPGKWEVHEEKENRALRRRFRVRWLHWGGCRRAVLSP